MIANQPLRTSAISPDRPEITEHLPEINGGRLPALISEKDSSILAHFSTSASGVGMAPEIGCP